MPRRSFPAKAEGDTTYPRKRRTSYPLLWLTCLAVACGEGGYSNKSRRLRNKSVAGDSETLEIIIDDEQTPYRKQCRMRWAALIQRVYEIDPLKCPNCGGKMKVISFIEKHQADLIEKILRHCDLWIDPRDRGRPTISLDEYVDFELSFRT